MLIKILKISGITILIAIIALASIPFLFKDQIKAKIEETINNNLNAKVSFDDADLSLLKNFPNATVSLEKLLIINKAPFEGDTLVSLGELHLKMSIKELFKGENESMNIDEISTKNGIVNIIFNKDGLGNFDIALKKEEEKKEEEKSKPFSLKIKEYSIENYRITYFDESSKMKMVIDSLNHEGVGDFAASKLDLNTKSSAKVSFTMDKANYMNKVALSLDAVLGIDLEKSKYSFKQNKAMINQLPLEFDGFIQMVPEGQVYDLTFKTPTSSFKNFLGLIPAAYASSMEGVKTSGDFTIVGFAKGNLTETTIPKFNIEIASNNASFQYPNLPKSVQNIVIDTKIINETGLINDTYVNLDRLSFKIDQDVFYTKANIKNITVNPLIDAALKGTINLGNLSKAYPVKLDIPLSGILKADVTTNFDMKSVETAQYQNIKNAGTMSLSGFKYAIEKGKIMTISQAAIAFNPSRVTLQKFNATTGKSDLDLTGTLDNFYGFMFKNQVLKGKFNLVSNQFAVADFMTASAPATTTDNADKPAETKSTAKKEAVKIPAFIDCTVNAKINTILYDNLALKNASGSMVVRDQKVDLQNIKTSIFGGTITADGDVSTKEKTPSFKMNLGLNQIEIKQAFTQLEMLKKIAPIAGVIEGKLNTKMQINGFLDAYEMTPDMKTLSGNMGVQIQEGALRPENSKVLGVLTNSLKFIDPSKLNMKNVNVSMTFQNSIVNIKPFDMKYQDINATIQGTHTFDQVMNYNMKLDVPAKYLGNEANKLASKLNNGTALKNIPVNVMMTGNFDNPKITTDLQKAALNLAGQLADQQKEKLINQGTKALDKLLISKGADTTKTKTPTEAIKKNAGKLIDGLFKKK